LLRAFIFVAMFMKKIFTFLIAVVLLSSCVSQTKMLQLMNAGSKLPAINNDQELSVDHVNTSIYFGDVQGVRQWPQVSQKKSYCIPLIVFNNWNSTYDCQVGLRDLEQNLKPNIETALKSKLNNSAFFRNTMTYDTASYYTLEVSVDTIQSHISFVSKGLIIVTLYANVQQTWEGVKESDMAIVTSYRLMQHGQVLKEATVRTKHTLEPGPKNTGSKKKYMRWYLDNYFQVMNQLIGNNASKIVSQLETIPPVGQ